MYIMFSRLSPTRLLTFAFLTNTSTALIRTNTSIRPSWTRIKSFKRDVAQFQTFRAVSTNRANNLSKNSTLFKYRLVAGVVLCRSPVITRDLIPFEEEYYKYQQVLEQIHSAQFPVEFYFKKGSSGEKLWKEKLKLEISKEMEMAQQEGLVALVNERQKMARFEIDKNDELQESQKVNVADRVTEADRIQDMKSLDRALQRTLYLIVKKPRDQHSWQFPQGGLEKQENLYQAAKRELAEECGRDMDVWFVGRRPIGVYQYRFVEPIVFDQNRFDGAKVFFMKAHIFAGQAKVDHNEIVDFAWVTKQEMQEYVHPDYYAAVKDMLASF
ncbi:hypothetical protein G9A89_002997 [Geosiphon pyriformis]|nr:hypothetical protein G9A89_002997 [Geosiphon pyriformis]